MAGTTCVASDRDTTIITPTDPPAGTFASGSASAPLAPQQNPVAIDANASRPTVDPTTPIAVVPGHDVTPLFPPPPPAQLVCDASFVACHGACIPAATDAANCGACGKVCPSNICVDGECQGATPGDVVLIGHDFTNAWSGSAQAKVLVNALTIPTTDPIRVLSYEEAGSAGAINQAKALAAAGIHGRSIQFTVAPSADALTSATLAKSFDIVLLHDASAADAVATGTSWSDSLGTFTMKGGVVVALDRGTSPVPELLTSSGLLAVGSHTLLSDGTHLAVTGAGDVVGAQVLSPYAGFGAPVSFQGLATPSLDLSWVVRTQGAGGTLGDAVVVHRIVR
jgi:ferredoxin